MSIQEKLTELGLELPPVAAPAGAYVPAVATGNLVFSAGQLPIKAGTLIATGHVPQNVTLVTAQACARQAFLNALAAVASVAGGIDRIARIVRLNVFVNSSAGFTEQAKVANGASDLLLQLFGDAGKHTRCAIGAAELPLNAPVELDIVAEVRT